MRGIASDCTAKIVCFALFGLVWGASTPVWANPVCPLYAIQYVNPTAYPGEDLAPCGG